MTEESTTDGPAVASSAFVRYLAGQATSMFGDGTVAVTYAFAALAVTESGWAMPAVLLGLWIARMLFLGHGGTVADRSNRAAVMMWSDLIRLAAQAFTAVCFLIGDAQLWQLVLSAAVYGAATAYFVPSAKAILPQLVPGDRLQKVNASLGVIGNVSLLAGPAIATALYSVGGVALPLGFDVLTFAVSVVSLATIMPALRRRHRPVSAEPSDAAAPAPDPHDDEVPLRNAFAVLAQYPVVAWIVGVWCLVQVGVASVNVLGPIVARDGLGGVEHWAVLATVMAVGGLVGSAGSAWLRTTRPTVVVLVLLGTLMPFQLLAMAWPHLVVLSVLVALTSAGLAVCGVLFDTYLQSSFDESELGRISAAEDGLTSAMIPVGLAISLPLATLVGRTQYLTGLAILILVTAVAAFVLSGPGAKSVAREDAAEAI